MCDSRLPAPALCRSLPESVRVLLGRAAGCLLPALCLVCGLSFPAGAQARTPTLSVSPTTSTDGSYTVTWSKPATAAIRTRLFEKAGRGDWSQVGTGTYYWNVTSKAFTGKAAGVYSYKTSQCITVFGSVSCRAAAGPVSVTVTAAPTKPPPPPAKKPPATPAKPAVRTGTGQLAVSWTAPAANGSPITRYSMHYKAGAAGRWTTHPLQNAGTATGTALTGLTNGVTYRIQVRAHNAGGVSAFSAAARGTPLAAPAAAGPARSAGTHTITWRAASAAASYRLRGRRGKGGAWAEYDMKASTSRGFTGVAPGAWTYQARACNSGGCGDWGTAARVVVTAPPATLPDAPAKPTGPGVSTGTHTIKWQAVGGATRYRVRESGDGGKNWAVSDYQATLARTFEDRTVGTWQYQVQACTNTANGCGPWSGTLSVRVTGPVKLTIAPNPSPDGEYTVSWAAPAHAVLKVRLWQQVEKNGRKAAWTVVGTYAGTTTGKAFSQGRARATYHYKAAHCITVFGSTVCLGESKAVRVTVAPPATPAIPTGLTSTTPDARGHYTVSWNTVTGATDYKLRESDDGGKTWDTTYPIAKGTSKAFTDKDPGDRTYAVRACHSAAATPCSDWSATLEVTVPALPAPENLTAIAPTPTGNYTVSWAAVTHATRYQLQESDDGGTTWDNTYPIATGTRQAFTNKSRGARTYRARACRARSATCGAWSDPHTVSVGPPPPAVPTGLTSTTPDARGNYTVSWAAVTGVADYTLRESDDDDTTRDTTYAIAKGTKKAFTGKAPGDWTYQVRACNAGACSGWSDSTDVTVPRLGAPANLAATVPDADGDYTLSWDAVTHATRYRLQESDDGGTTWDNTYPIATGASKAFAGKAEGAWTYRARACRRDNVTCGAWSGAVTVTVPGPPAQPDAPTLTPGDGQLSVAWAAPDDNGSPITGYALRHREYDNDDDWSRRVLGSTDTGTTIAGLTNGTDYEVQVQAANARGNSPWSESATAVPRAALAAPGNLRAPTASTGAHTVRWDPVPGAGRYELQARRDGAARMTHNTGTATHQAFSALAKGAWTYRARACAGRQCGPWSRAVTVTVGAGSIPAPPDPDDTRANAVIDDAEKARIDRTGSLPGSFRVTESGAAAYRIDIPLPPGTGGVVPPLALSYDSQRGNGPLGTGWALEGLSAVTRCRPTLSQDGAARPLTFTGTDRFCLDGQRLLLSDGAANKNRSYGDAGTEYRTETDSFAIVTAKGGTAGHPDYFEVQRKDGATATYGAQGADDSEHKLYAGLADKTPTGKVLTWAVQAVEDSVGNKITYHYTHATDGHRLTRIRYAYGASKTVHQAEVVLAYEARKDPSAGYLAGHPLRHGKRLSTMTVRGAGHPGRTALSTALSDLRRYQLRYADSPGTDPIDTLSRLVGIKACVGKNWAACQPETTFQWSAPAPLFKSTAATTLTLNTEKKWSPVDFNPADINGDGRTDLVWTETRGSKHRLRYALADKSTGRLVASAFVGGKTSLEYDDDYGTNRYGDNLRVHTEVVDYNGDGRHDLLVYSAEADETRLHLAVPQAAGGWRLSAGAAANDRVLSGRYRYADMNSDGLLDAYKLVVAEHSPLDSRVPMKYALEVRYLKPASGRMPSSNRYYAFAPAQTIAMPFTQLAPTPPADDSPPGTPSVYYQWHTLEQADVPLADVNGDGRADLVTWGSTWLRSFGVAVTARRLEVFRQTQTGYARYGAAGGIPVHTTYTPKGLRAQDLNGDGLSDILYFVGTWYKKSKGNYQWTGNWHYRLSTGTGYTAPTALTAVAAGAQAPSALSLYDDNGDGYPDALYHDVKSNALVVRRYRPNTGTYAAKATVRRTRGKDAERFFAADLSGDGNADLLHVPESGGGTETLAVYHHNSATRPHLVTRITSGLGAKTEMTYESLSRTAAYARINGLRTARTEERRCFTWGSARFCWPVQTAHLNANDFYTDLNAPWADQALTDSLAAPGGPPVLELMGPLYVVTRVDSSAPTARDASASSSVCYLYEQAKIQAAGRGLLGFKALTTMDLQTGVSTTTAYRQDFPYIGYPRSTEVRTQDGHLLRAATNTWRLKGYRADDPATPKRDEGWAARAAAQGSAGLGALQPYLEKAVESTYDLPTTGTKNGRTTTTAGAKLTSVTTDTEMDAWGNPTQITVTTDDHANGLTFLQRTVNRYGATAGSQRYGRLSRATVTRQRDNNGDKDYADKGETLTRASAFTYYPSGAHKGLLRTEVRAPADSALKHETRYDYDRFGHRVRAAVTAGGETRCDHDTVQYDASGRFIVQESDCLGRPRRTFAGHTGWGRPVTEQRRLDAQHATRVLTTTHRYTAGGRLYFTRDATGHHSGRLDAPCRGVAHCPAGAAWYRETRTAGGGIARTYRDVLDRVVRAAVAGFRANAWVLTDTGYDNLGRVARRSEPYYAGETAYWTTHAHDLLGRVVKTTLPDHAVDKAGTVTVNSVLTLAHAGLATTVTNGQGQATTETRNALGEVIKTTDAQGTPVTHAYDAWGQVTRTTTGTGNNAVTVTRTYDGRGRRVREDDPDRGTWTYRYNGFDERVWQRDALGNIQTWTHDGLGRVTRRREHAAGQQAVAGEVSWLYDTAPYGLGQAQSVLDSQRGSHRRLYAYDTLGRAHRSTLILGGAAYFTRRTYDEYGRPYQRYDAARTGPDWTDNVTETRYNGRGYAYQWTDGVYVNNVPRASYRTITAQDARGNVTGETLGGGAVRAARTFDARTGRTTGITGQQIPPSGRARTLQAATYTWDTLGNLTERREAAGAKTLTESFTYDSLNRLTEAQVGSNTPQTVTYDALGNITDKTGVGTYTYGTTATATPGPHAAVQAGDLHYSYDANGNVTAETRAGDTDPARSFTYTPFNKVKTITRGTHTTAFVYGPARARLQRTDTVRTNRATSTTVTTYLGNVEHVLAPDGSYTYRRHVADGTLIIQRHDKTGRRTDAQTRHLLHDHLGSVVRITAASGAIRQALSYDAWGQRREPDTWTVLALLTLQSTLHSQTTTRGFTGHEMLDAVGVIHMNGRIYDPRLGRFLQADPIIQLPHHSQGQNRYSYVLNNPLAYIDPSGYFFKKLFKGVKGLFKGLNRALGDFAPFLGIALLALPGMPGWVMTSWGHAFGFGFVTGGIATGSLRGALFGGISAAAFYGIGQHFTALTGLPEGGLGHVLTHGVAGGVLAELQGGQFGHGFLAAGISKAVMGRFNYHDGSAQAVMGRTTIAAIVGGTISRITGGKFANGALTAAMAQLFNNETSAARARTAFQERYGEILDKAGIDIRQNMIEAGDMSKLEIIKAVWPGGKWDYKNLETLRGFSSDLLQEFGNVHFGIVARAHGFTLEEALYGAGYVQVNIQGGGSRAELQRAARMFSTSLGGRLMSDSYTRSITLFGFTWGDNPGDSIDILRGWYHAPK